MDRHSFAKLEQMVSDGAAHLDGEESLWYVDIDTRKLRMSSSHSCVVGQLRPDESFGDGLRSLGIDYYQALELGFDLDVRYIDMYGHSDFELLTLFWTKEIMARRAAK